MFLFHRDDRKFVPTTGPWLINFGMINHNQVYNREQCTLNSKLGDSSIISSLPIRHPDFFFFFWICFLFILSVYYRKPAKLTHGYLFDLKKNAKQNNQASLMSSGLPACPSESTDPTGPKRVAAPI